VGRDRNLHGDDSTVDMIADNPAVSAERLCRLASSQPPTAHRRLIRARRFLQAVSVQFPKRPLERLERFSHAHRRRTLNARSAMAFSVGFEGARRAGQLLSPCHPRQSA
jgi:hypothetical protein